MELNVFERLAARMTGGFVLAFHGISPARFTALVECLGAFRPVHLGEIVERAKSGRPNAGLFAITVDDGVGDNVRTLAAVLQARQWPGTFYLPTGYLDTGDGMPFQRWRKIEDFLPGIMPPRARRDLAQAMRKLMHTQPRGTYEAMVEDLAGRLVRESGVAPAALEPPAPITWAEVARLARSETIRFESHGISHTAMSALGRKEMAFEMKLSRDLITERAGRECRHFAYPYGSERSIGALAPVMAARYYDSAATMTLGAVDSANPWLLPRIPLYEENSRAFARLKVFLKCSVARVVQGRLPAWEPASRRTA
jgi:peptidoglycan/xylan/chitin deacetylase (PgdA/CDA1 family)